MKREKKDLVSRSRIPDNAAAEFTENGGLRSVNAISGAGDISGGILYHCFEESCRRAVSVLVYGEMAPEREERE